MSPHISDAPVSRGAAARPRLLGVDIARTAAITLMVIAHVAPSDGPARILLLSEFLTAPMFALLIGVGAQLGERDARRTLIRASLVAVLGLLLQFSQAQVVIVLVHLAVVMVACIPLVGRRTRTLVPIGMGILVAAVLLPAGYRLLLVSGSSPDELVVRALGVIGGAGPYRPAAMIAAAVTGMLLVRAVRRMGLDRSMGIIGAGVLLLGLFGTLVIVPNLLGLREVHAYDGTPLEITGVIAGAAGLFLVCWGGANVLLRGGDTGLIPGILAQLAAPGAMSLSLYAAQVLVLHLFVVLHPGQRDDSWALLCAMIIAGAAFAMAWKAAWSAARRRTQSAPSAIDRGPLEGLIEVLVRLSPSAPASSRA